MQAYQIPTIGQTPISLPVAQLPRRAMAGIIDAGLIGLYLALWAGFIQWSTQDLSNLNWLDTLVVGFSSRHPMWYLALLPALLYSWWTGLMWDGQSLGKRLLHLRVINESGGAASLIQLGIRWALRTVDIWLGALILLPGLPGVLVGIFTTYGQRLGGIFSGTLVIHEKALAPLRESYTTVDETHTIEYPEVVQLSDRDIAILKEILHTSRRKRDEQYMERLAARVSTVMGIVPRHPAEVFLEHVLQDYHYYYAHLVE